jgi:hypothetical protein
MRLFLLLFIAATMLPGCLSGVASKCNEWQTKHSFYQMGFAVLERHDISVCTSFSEVP